MCENFAWGNELWLLSSRPKDVHLSSTLPTTQVQSRLWPGEIRVMTCILIRKQILWNGSVNVCFYLISRLRADWWLTITVWFALSLLLARQTWSVISNATSTRVRQKPAIQAARMSPLKTLVSLYFVGVDRVTSFKVKVLPRLRCFTDMKDNCAFVLTAQQRVRQLPLKENCLN